jgi:aspartate/methionine/tyrosine aminotransferase
MASSLSPLAVALNEQLGPQALSLLSKRGQAIFFPSKGILGQAAEAKSSSINATIGTAFEEDGSPLTLELMEQTVNLPSETFLYAPSQGNPAIREQWKAMILAKSPTLQGKSYSLPVVTNALTHGLSVAGYLFLDEGDTVIIPDLFWDNYELVFGNAYGAKLLAHNTFTNGGYDLPALEAAIEQAPGNRKVILLNFPNNPTGYTLTDAEAQAMKALLLRRAQKGEKLVVLLDDAYFGLVYEKGVYTESLFALLADLHENILAVKLDGPTKEDYVWGFRVGFISFAFKGAAAPQLAALEAKAAGTVRGNISNASSIGQAILLKAWKDPAYAVQKQQKFEILARRYRKIVELLAAHPEYAQSFVPTPFNSGYFMCVKPVGVEAEAVRKELLANFGTGVIVLSGLVRLAFSAVPTDKLEQLFANLHGAIRKLQG